jgi:lysophospholipid acyltransferase (LPLAT)-like uncharacterized protein
MLKKLWLKIKMQGLPYLIAYFARIFIRILLATCRIKIKGLEQFIDVATKQACILMLWHNRLALISEILFNCAPQFVYAAFISKSRDGEPLAILAQSYPCGKAIRVPHNARYYALNKMIQHLKDREIILITPDGPRGPRYVVKPGIIIAAKESAANIVPFHWEAGSFWRLNTWDKMMIPKPFSTISISFGDPIALTKDAGRTLEEEISLLQSSLPF